LSVEHVFAQLFAFVKTAIAQIIPGCSQLTPVGVQLEALLEDPSVLESTDLKRWQPYSMERGPAT
jgi:hypothetical protein